MKTIIERIKTQITQLEKEKKDYLNLATPNLSTFLKTQKYKKTANAVFFILIVHHEANDLHQ